MEGHRRRGSKRRISAHRRHGPSGGCCGGRLWWQPSLWRGRCSSWGGEAALAVASADLRAPAAAPVFLDRYGGRASSAAPGTCTPTCPWTPSPSTCVGAVVAIEDVRFSAVTRARSHRHRPGAPASTARKGALRRREHHHPAAGPQALPHPGTHRPPQSAGSRLSPSPWKPATAKPSILELYLNRVYFGEGAYGIEAAACRSTSANRAET